MLPCEVSAPHAATDGAREAMEMRLKALEGQLEETRRGLEEAERIRAAELVLLKGELLTVRGELVTVRGELLTTRGELATVKGELDALKGTLLGPRKEFAEQRECVQEVKEKLAFEEEVKEPRKGVSSDEAAAMSCPTAKHVEFDVEEELRMRRGIHRMVWQLEGQQTIACTHLPAAIGHHAPLHDLNCRARDERRGELTRDTVAWGDGRGQGRGDAGEQGGEWGRDLGGGEGDEQGG
ncbi:unnamed protein product [Closterium sp. NIES-65]|nr:unnamed protein product [Closterium sp. NIES-65]